MITDSTYCTNMSTDGTYFMVYVLYLYYHDKYNNIAQDFVFQLTDGQYYMQIELL